jgi:hypothetical protein
LDDEGYWNGNDVEGSQQQGLRDEIVGDVTNPLTNPKVVGVSPCLRVLTRGLRKGSRWEFCNHEMKVFATLDKAKPDIENIRGLNLAAVSCTTIQV